MGRVRLLRLTLALLLGPAPAPGRHPGRATDRVRPCRREGRRTPGPARDLPYRPDPTLTADRPGQTLISDKNYYGAEFEAHLAENDLKLLRPARKGEAPRPGARLFAPLRQTIESINQTFKGQLDLERHGGHTPNGVLVRVLQRILALTAAIWHNDKTGAPVHRSLTAYDH
jgi:hypothetical protein